jgi:hypothetical protein
MGKNRNSYILVGKFEGSYHLRAVGSYKKTMKYIIGI